MSAIAGVLTTRTPPPAHRSLIERMAATLHLRGPDGTHFWIRDGVSVAVARHKQAEAVISANPTENGHHAQRCIVFDGKLFNHRALRADLLRQGHCLDTETDDELVLRLYQVHGRHCLDLLRGAFAFAIIDGQTLFLARDRLGFKPLYYTVLPGRRTLLFASEIKAILQCPDYTPQLCRQALADAFVLSYPVGQQTYFEGVKTLPPGHFLTVSRADTLCVGAPQSYYSRFFQRSEDLTFEAAQQQLDEVLIASVQTQLDTDEEVGVTLSGGLDSTILALLAGEHRAPLATFTVSDHEGYSDFREAKRIAAWMGSEHHAVVIGFDEFLEAIPRFAAAREGPCNLSGVPYYLLCHHMAQRVGICMAGVGPNDLFGDFGTNWKAQQRARRRDASLRVAVLKKLGMEPSYRALDCIARLTSAASFSQYIERMIEWNNADDLERNNLAPFEKFAMLAGLETRMPYLDERVFDFAMRLPLRYLVNTQLGIRRYLYRRYALKRFGDGIADTVLRNKRGMPTAGKKFLLARFDRLCDEILPADYVERHEWGRCFPKKRLLVMFEFFLVVFMEHRGDYTAVGSIVDFMKERASVPLHYA